MDINKLNESSRILINRNCIDLVNNSMFILNKILLTETEELFNKAIRLLNSKNLLDSEDNFLLILDNYHIHNQINKFRFLANSEFEYFEALKIWNILITLKPNKPLFLVMRAITKCRLRDVNGGINDFETAILVDSQYYFAHNGLGCTKHYFLKDHINAIIDFSQAIELNPNYAAAYLNRGNAKISLKNYQGAIEDFSKVIAIDPKHSRAFYFRGNAKQYFRDLEGAVDDYNFSILLDSKNEIAFINRGFAKWGLSDYQSSIEDFTIAIELNPNNTTAYLSRGKVKRRLKDFQGAIEDFSKVIEIDPKHYDAFYSRGKAKYNSRDFEGAVEDYNFSILLDPKNEYALFNRGLTKSRMNDHLGAIEDYSLAINLNQNYTSAYLKRGIAKNNLKDYLSAVEDFSKVIDLDPNYPNVYFHRGTSKHNLKDYVGAIEDISIARDANPDANIGDLYRGISQDELLYMTKEIENHSEAIETLCASMEFLEGYDIESAIEDLHSSYVSRAEIKERIKDYWGAIEDYSRAIETTTDKYLISKRGKLKEKIQDFNGAIEDYTEAIESLYLYITEPSPYDPNQEEAWEYFYRVLDKWKLLHYDIGRVKEKMGDKNGAIEQYNTALDFWPANDNYRPFNNGNALEGDLINLFMRGKALYDIKRFKAAVVYSGDIDPPFRPC